MEPTPREALVRLVRSLLSSTRPQPWATSIDTDEGLEAILDTSEAHDFALVMDALAARPPFAFTHVAVPAAPGPRTVAVLLDLKDVTNERPEARTVSTVTYEGTAHALANLLNSNPEAWDRALSGTKDEPF